MKTLILAALAVIGLGMGAANAAWSAHPTYHTGAGENFTAGGGG
jgi:hypothetical protein